MTKNEFWKKWIPCDWPAVYPDKKKKKEFYADIDKLIKTELEDVMHEIELENDQNT